MGGLFNFIAKLIEKRPVKVLLITTLAFIVMISGARFIKMATGNETLVKTTTDAYQSNVRMEESFGGDSIIVLFEGETQDSLLSQKNLESMWKVQQEMQYEENIFTFVSPASTVNQVTEKQSEVIKDNVKEISDGLAEMGDKMTEIGQELAAKDIKDPKEMEKKLDELSQATSAFDKMIAAQNKMGNGAANLKVNMGELSSGLENVSMQLTQLGKSVENNPKLSQQLQTIAGKIQESSSGLGMMSEKTGELQKGNEQTANALNEMKNKLSTETESMKSGLDGGLTPDQVKEMADGFVEMGGKLNDISEGLGEFYDKSGMMVANIPTEQSEIDEILYEEDGQLKSLFSDLIVDDTNALMIVKLNGNLEDSQKDAVYQKLENVLEKQEFESVSYMISGKPVLDSSLRAEMQANMQNMVILAVGIMLVVLMLIFKVRWRILPLITIFIAVIATLGIMGSAGIPMTMVSMAVFPILIGLGIDYSIQFQSRYQEEKSLKTTLKSMGPAVGTAVFATVLGFIALYISPVPMVQDFGKMLTIGVIISYIAGIFLLMSIIYIRDRFFTEEKKQEQTRVKANKTPWLEKALSKMTKGIVKGSVLILLVSILITGWGIWADGKVGVQTDIESFMPQDTQALQDIHKLREVLGSTDQLVLYIEDDDLLAEGNLAWVEQKTSELEEKYPDMIVDTKSIMTLVNKMNTDTDRSYADIIETINDIPESQKKMFITEDESRAIITLNIKHVPVGDLDSFINSIKKDIRDTDMNVKVTGKSVLDVAMVEGLTSGRVEMTFLGMGLVFVGLLLVYRHPIKAFIPVFPISLIVGMSGGIMYILGLKYTPLTATLGALILGIGTEMTILLLERYLEERKNGAEKLEAIQTAVSKIGTAIIASGITTIGGFSVLMISDFVILQDFGLMTVINMTLALFSTLVVLPPVIYLLDRWITKREPARKTVPILDR